VLNSDERRFGGHDRIDNSGRYFTTDLPWNNRANFLQVRFGHPVWSVVLGGMLIQAGAGLFVFYAGLHTDSDGPRARTCGLNGAYYGPSGRWMRFLAQKERVFAGVHIP
jgi:hypothetical protein